MSAQAVQPVEGARTPAQRVALRMGLGDWAFSGVAQVLLGLWALMVIFPFLWMIMTSFKTDSEILFSPWRLPAAMQWDNFVRACDEARIGCYVFHSLIMSAGVLTGTLLFSSMAAYGLARVMFPLKRCM